MKTIELDIIEAVRPFHCGSQHADWEGSNCDRCTKNTLPEAGTPTCDIQRAIYESMWGDGTIATDIAKRMGYGNQLAYLWKCGEVEWTPEWIAESRRRATHRYRFAKWRHGVRVKVRKWLQAKREARRMKYANKHADRVPETCWASWVSWALGDNEFPEAGNNARCREESKRDGTCYCGKFENGEAYVAPKASVA